MAKWSNEKVADLTRKLADTAIDYKQRCEDIDAAFTNLHREYDRRGDRIEELEAKLAKAAEALQWFIDNDDTNEGDEPMPDRGGRTWNEINAYWVEGLNNGRTTLAELTGGKDDNNYI
jgi:hypothetical protein